MAIIVPSDPLGGISSRYVLYGLRATEQSLAILGTGSTFQAISGNQLRAHPLPLAPVAQQQRLVDAIETHFTRLDAAIASLQRVKGSLKRYRASVLRAACEGRLVPTEAELARAEGRGYESADKLLARILQERRTRWEVGELSRMQTVGKPPKDGAWRTRYVEPRNPDASDLPELPEGWCWATLDQLLVLLRNGIGVKPDGDTGAPMLRISAVRPGSVNLGDFRFLHHFDGRLQDFALSEGDLLFTRYNGNPSLVGVCGAVGPVNRLVVHPDKLIRVKLVTHLAVPRFLQPILNTGPSRRHIAGRTRTTAGQAGISGEDLRTTPTPLAPLNEQHRIASEVDRRLSLIEDLETMVEANLKRTERLRQSLLKLAFEGNLVPQDPNDEPAETLLARIELERGDQLARKRSPDNQALSGSAAQPALFNESQVAGTAAAPE